jgi:hypothetical protein
VGSAHSRSVSTFNQKSGIGECNCEIPLEAHSVGLRDVLKMQDRTDEQLLTALQDAARCTYASLVLVEALRGRVSGHAHIDALQVSVPITVVEPYEVNVPPPPLRCLKPCRDLVDERQPRYIAHRQPFGYRLRCVPPQLRKCGFNVAGEGIPHPSLVNAVRARDTIAGCERLAELRVQLEFLRGPQRTRGRLSFLE